MTDERIIRRAALRLENLLYSFTVSCITSETIYGLCGKPYDFAFFQMLSAVLDALLVRLFY